MNKKNFKIIGLALVAITLLSSNYAQARRVKNVESYSATEIANIVVGSIPFYHLESMFLSGIPDNISRSAAESIRENSWLKGAKDVLVIDFRDFVELVKTTDVIGLYKLKSKYNHIITYGFYTSSEEHTADDVVQAVRVMRGWRNEALEKRPLHIIISEKELDWKTVGKYFNTPFVNYLTYYQIVDGELKHPPFKSPFLN